MREASEHVFLPLPHQPFYPGQKFQSLKAPERRVTFDVVRQAFHAKNPPATCTLATQMLGPFSILLFHFGGLKHLNTVMVLSYKPMGWFVALNVPESLQPGEEDELWRVFPRAFPRASGLTLLGKTLQHEPQSQPCARSSAGTPQTHTLARLASSLQGCSLFPGK